MMVSGREAVRLLAEKGLSISRSRLSKIISEFGDVLCAGNGGGRGDGGWERGKSLRVDFDALLAHLEVCDPASDKRTETSGAQTLGWVTLTEAWSRLNKCGDVISLSALSRYVQQHAEAIPSRRNAYERSAPLMVMWDDLRIHRQENIRVLAPQGQDTAHTPPESPATKGRRFVGTQADAAARKVNAEAEIKELDLALRRGELVPRAEVDRAARDAVALMLSAFERAIDTAAASAALKYGWDERQVRLVLKSHVKEGQGVFHRELLTRLEAIGPDGATAAVEVGGED